MSVFLLNGEYLECLLIEMAEKHCALIDTASRITITREACLRMTTTAWVSDLTGRNNMGP